jgi:hypothetical protein
MATKEKATQDWALDVSDEELSKANPNNFGGEFRRVRFGDYDGEIVDWQLETKEGAKPHQMSVVTFKITKAYASEGEGYVGDMITARYAGSPQSPKMMQDSRARLFGALKIGAGKLTRSAVIGRKITFSVIWNLAKPYMNQETGQTTRSVFANVTAERPAGAPRPTSLDVERLSEKAAKWLEETYGDDETSSGEAQEWEKPATPSPDAGGSGTEEPAQATFKPEDEIADDADVMTYRAHVKLKTEHADDARAALVDQGIDPDGPINVKVLPEELQAALNPKPAKPALPSLGGAKKGTRTKAA